MVREWEFEEDSKDVDIDRIWGELNGGKAIMVMAYLSELKRNAPIVFKRFAEAYPVMGCINVKGMVKK